MALAKLPADLEPPAYFQASSYLLNVEWHLCCRVLLLAEKDTEVSRGKAPVSTTTCLLHGPAWSGPRFLVSSAPTCKLVGMDRSSVAMAFAASTGALGQKGWCYTGAGRPGGRSDLGHDTRYCTWFNNESDTSRPWVTWAGI